jgi:hypothetical protein
MMRIDRSHLAEELWRFGEEGLALRMDELNDDEILRIWKLGGRLLMHDRARSNGEAAAAAAVIVMTGEDRPLSRRRRRPKKGMPDFGEERGDHGRLFERVMIGLDDARFEGP